MWEQLLRTLCNQTHFHVFDRYNFGGKDVGNGSTNHILSESSATATTNQTTIHTIYYFDDCFQQAALIAPTYLFALSLIAYCFGRYGCGGGASRLSSSRFRYRNSMIIFVARISTIIGAVCVQCIALYLLHDRLTLLAQYIIGLKLATSLTYLALIVTNFRLRFCALKYAIILLSITAASETVTNYLSEWKRKEICDPNYCAKFLCIGIVSCVLWFVHFAFTITPDRPMDGAESLLINDADENSGEPVDNGLRDNAGQYRLLRCDERQSYASQLFFHWVSPLLDRGLASSVSVAAETDQSARRRALESAEDLFELPYSLNSYSVCDLADEYLDEFEAAKKKQKKNKQSSPEPNSRHLIGNLFRQFGARLVAIGALKIGADSCAFSSPIFLNRILLYLENTTTASTATTTSEDSTGSGNGFRFAFALFAVTLLNAILIAAFNFQITKLSLRVRTLLLAMLYHKLFRVRSTDIAARFGTGRLLNLANVDIERVVNFSPSLYQFISLPAQLAITLYLLYAQVGIVFLGAVAFILALIPLNRAICNRISAYSRLMMMWKDRRLRLMSEILRGIRTIKMHAWERSFAAKIVSLRTNEIRYLRWRKYLDALCVYFWATTPVIVSSVVFGTFAAVNGADRLTAANVFTSLALLSMLITPLNALPWVLNGLIEALVSVRRLNAFIVMSEIDPINDYAVRTNTENNDDDDDDLVEAKKAQRNIAFELPPGCSFDYASSETNNDSANDCVFRLRLRDDISPLQFAHHSFVAIVGRVGSGKTTLFRALLNELHLIGGSEDDHADDGDNVSASPKPMIDHELLSHGIGYVSQESWIRDTSVRENILFGAEFDAERYRRVVEATALLSDFELFPRADHTMVGNHGATLSGGQRARIALARALYQDFAVYLLDEPFASVDRHVAAHIYDKCFRGYLLRERKCVIMATNHLQYAREADMIVTLKENGEIDKPMHTMSGGVDRANLWLHAQQLIGANDDDDQREEEERSGGGGESAANVDCVNDAEKVLVKKSNETNREEEQEEEEEEEEETREIGRVKMTIYLAYIGAIGYALFALIIASIIGMQGTKTASDFWLSFWTQHKQQQQQHQKYTNYWPNSSSSSSSSNFTFYLYVFIAIAIANSIITAIRAFVFAIGGIRAAISLHDRLLDFVIRRRRTSLRFFDSTPFGVVINRFSSDVFNVDDALPFTLNIFFAQISGLAAGIIVTIYGMPWIALLVVPLILPYYLIQKYFRATSRELKRLSAVSLSPIYSQLDDTIQGLTTIRAFVRSGIFKQDLYRKVNAYNRIQYAINAVQQWLNLRLQLLGVAVTAAVALIAVTLHYYYSNNSDSGSGGQSINSGLIGLALVYSLSLTGLLNGSVQAFTQTELDLISVERITQLLATVRDEFDFYRCNNGDADNVVPAEIEEEEDDEDEEEDHHRINTTAPLFDSTLQTNDGIVCFQDVSMRYRAELDHALRNVSFMVESGQHVAIVGRTGSGKSSLFQALFRLTPLAGGTITIDGVDIATIGLARLRSRMFIIPQDAFLYSGTIRENLDPLGSFRDDRLWTALYQCGINLLVDSIGGLDAELRENGADLSVGQRHLFCFARALLNRRSILCMDEMTANIDRETELIIAELVRTVLRRCTVLHIAHKIESIADYDRVIVIEDGRVAEICDAPQYARRHSHL